MTEPALHTEIHPYCRVSYWKGNVAANSDDWTHCRVELLGLYPVGHEFNNSADPMDVRRSEFDTLKRHIQLLIGHEIEDYRDKKEPTRNVQAEQPMTFYDCAFIAAYMDLRSAEYDDMTHMQRAHAIAAKLTRNRAVPS